jgi:hypothetical protein
MDARGSAPGRRPSAVFGGDAVCCSNWDSIPGLEGAFRRLCETDLPRVPFVFDPGDGRTALGVHRGDTDRSAAIREAAGSTAAVIHARDEAAAATSAGARRVENYRIDRPERHTGGGSRAAASVRFLFAPRVDT